MDRDKVKLTAAATAAKIEAPRRMSELRRGAYKLLAFVMPAVNGAPQQPLRLFPLFGDDALECYGCAIAALHEKGVDPADLANRQQLEDETLTQILFRALRQPEGDSDVPFHADADDCRACWTPDERSMLADAYNDFRASIDPDPRQMTNEMLAELKDLAKKKREETLVGFGARRLALLAIFMADQLGD